MNKKDLFNEMVHLSCSINERIIKSGINFEDDFDGDRNREIIEVELAEDERAILILGINPSVNRGKGEDKYPNINFLKSVNCDRDSRRSKKSYELCKKYTNSYHQQRYDYICKGYSMMWEKEEYLDKYLEEYSQITDEEYKIKDKRELKEYLEAHKCNSRNYILFTDLLHLKVTEARKIELFLGDRKRLEKALAKENIACNLSDQAYYSLQDDIFRLFILQLEYYNPRLIWSNSKGLKVFLEKYFNKERISIDAIYKRDNKHEKIWKAEYKGITIYFSVFFGGGAMTREEKAFLKQEVTKNLEVINMTPSEKGCNC